MPIVTHADAFVSRWTVKPERRAAFITQFNALWQDNTAIMNEVTNFVFYGFQDRRRRADGMLQCANGDGALQPVGGRPRGV